MSQAQVINKSQIYRHQNAFSTFYVLRNDIGYQASQKLFEYLNSDGFVNTVLNLFTEPSTCISSFRIYPFKKSVLGDFPDTYIRIGLCGVYPNVQANKVPDSMKIVRVAEFNVPEADSWIDLEPHTSMQLYLPFLDFVDIPVNEVRGNKLVVDYAIDLSTGVATAFVNCITSDVNNPSHVILIKNGKIGIDIAWGSSNKAENVRNVINTSVSTLASIGFSKVSTGLAIAKGSQSILNSLQREYKRGGNTGNLATLMSPAYAYLIIKKPSLVPINIGQFARTYGLPLYESRVLAELTGFTVVDEIHLTGLPDALEEEVNEIETLLKSGVHL